MLHISHERYPTIKNSIPIFNWIMDKIKDFDKEANIDEIVKKAAYEDLITNDNLFSHIYKKWYTSRNESELDLYLKSPIVSGKVDLLQWWRINESQYLHLAAMTRDYLAIPAISTPIEKAFLGGTNLINQKRCSLSTETIRACMCLKSWWKPELKCNK
uniref:HAT C-terminal dimerisation domain-containing protein n=1 Tax=Rhizophagus irregularis (strain DAOM 181602 / DAOM 197198 / MUCL 43194) TaxID=747089 RepID=U9T1K9_RHIID